MTHPLKKETIVEIDGMRFALVFDIRAIAEAERILHKSLILGLSQQMIEAPTTDEVCAMFFAAAKARQKDLTLAAVEQLLNAPTFPEAAKTLAIMRNAVLEAWMSGAVEQTESKDENPTPDQG